MEEREEAAGTPSLSDDQRQRVNQKVAAVLSLDKIVLFAHDVF